jgi:hypothetical protein
MGRSPGFPFSFVRCGGLPEQGEQLRKLRNTSGLEPLTPNFDAVKCGTTFHPAPAPDIHVEESLFRMYVQERDKAERYRKERNAARAEAQWLQTNLDKRKRWSRIKRLTQLIPKESQ